MAKVKRENADPNLDYSKYARENLTSFAVVLNVY